MFMLTYEKSIAGITFKLRELSHELFRLLLKIRWELIFQYLPT